MKLEKVRVQNFRSVLLTDFSIDDKLTAVIGENEHGKTNLLWSIKLLDFKTPIRGVDRRISRKATDPGGGSTSLIYNIKLDKKEVSYLQSYLLSKIVKGQDKPSLEGAQKTKKSMEDTDIPDRVQLQIDYKDGKKNDYNVLNIDKKIKKSVLEFVKSSMMNNVFFFDTFEECLKHKISKDEILDKTDNITNGLIKLAGLSGKEELIFEESPRARQILNDSSEKLTESLKKIWGQGRDDVIEFVLSVSHDGKHLTVDIGDPNTYGAISTRSRGFLFFISFILKFKECHDGDFRELIILIDEPGMFLHPKGQKNLLSYLENLATHNQVLYTTHSPFMVNRLKGNRVRIVQKSRQKGTQVNIRPYGNIDEAFVGGSDENA